MKKKIICALLALVMILGSVSVLAACGDDPTPDTPTECTHVDANKDGKCDKCGEKMSTSQTCNHVDANDDLVCDKCGEKIECTSHVDKNNDGKCDKCGKSLDHTCVDKDLDFTCDECGDEVVPDFWWDDATLYFQMSNNTCQDELSSGCERYLAGEYTGNDEDEIDEAISERNTAAMDVANISNVRYEYYGNVDMYGWGEANQVIIKEISSTDGSDLPDMYVNFVYDMVAASLQQCFANVYGTVRGQGNNYFPFALFRDMVDEGTFDEEEDANGYMYEYMTTMTLSKNKMYVIASDYFTDLIRAFFVVPVNIKLLEEVGMDITGDLNDDGEFTIEDFYEEVKQGKWTYNKVAAYSDKIYIDSANPGTQDINDRIGFALAAGGLSASGIVYTTSCTIINREWDDAENDYKYSYSRENEKLYALVDAVSNLVGQKGVLVVNQTSDVLVHGDTHMKAIRKRFAEDQVLFGGIILVGSLEAEVYQTMKESSGFGVVPVPLYSDTTNDIYLTQIHNVGRAGAISVKTTKFEQCTAFLGYQSTHSTDILDQYYDYKLQYDIADGSKGTVYMLQYIRNNVRSAFDKTFEDALGEFYDKADERWHSIILNKNYNLDIRNDYKSLIDSKISDLDALINQFQVLPD